MTELQHPIPHVDPAAGLHPYFAKVGDLRKSERFVQADAGSVRVEAVAGRTGTIGMDGGRELAKKKKGLHAFTYNPLTYYKFLVPLTGIELVTFALRMRSSMYIELF